VATRPSPVVLAPTPADPTLAQSLPNLHAVANSTPPAASVPLLPLTRFDHIYLDLWFFKWRYITLALSIVSLVDLIVAIVHSVKHLVAHYANDGELASAIIIASVWLMVATVAFVLFVCLYYQLAKQDILDKWPSETRAAYNKCTAFFRPERIGDLEAQIGGNIRIPLQDLQPLPAGPVEQESSTSNGTSVIEDDSTVPATPHASASPASPATPENKPRTEFDWPWTPKDVGVEIGGEGEETRIFI
jgi:hypothetical protein